MRKLLLLILVFLISLGFVNAVSFSTIMMIGNQVGLQIPAEMTKIIGQLSEAQQKILCVASPFDCATSQIKGKLIGDAFNALPPELQKTVNTYNQIKGYTDHVKGVISELKVNSDTGSISGCLPTKDKLKKICTNDINFKYDEETKIATYEFTDKNGAFSIDNPKYSLKFSNVKPKDENTNAYVKIGEKGDVTEADLTTNEKGSSFVFGDKKIDAPANTRVTYKDGQITVYANKKDTDFLMSDFADGKEGIPKNYIINGDGRVVFTGTGLAVYGNTTITDVELMYSVTNQGEDALFITDDPSKIAGNNWIVANTENLQYHSKSRIELLEGNNWIKNVNSESKLILDVDGEGSVYSEGLHISSGQVVSTSWSEGCNAIQTYTTQDVKETKGKVSCVSMQVFSSKYKYTINNEGGSAVTELCEENKNEIIGKSIFDVLTGRAIEWITGRQLYQAMVLSCTTIISQNPPQKKGTVGSQGFQYDYECDCTSCKKVNSLNDETIKAGDCCIQIAKANCFSKPGLSECESALLKYDKVKIGWDNYCSILKSGQAKKSKETAREPIADDLSKSFRIVLNTNDENSEAYRWALTKKGCYENGFDFCLKQSNLYSCDTDKFNRLKCVDFSNKNINLISENNLVSSNTNGIVYGRLDSNPSMTKFNIIKDINSYISRNPNSIYMICPKRCATAFIGTNINTELYEANKYDVTGYTKAEIENLYNQGCCKGG